MREPKFRAWDKITKKYYTVSTLEYSDNGELCEVWLVDIPVTNPELNEDCRSPKDVVLEQYTGLKDVNGNEIAEGDILEDGEGEPFEYWVIKFEDGKFIGETQGVTEDLFELTDLEIVGTICEHPEFLKGEK